MNAGTHEMVAWSRWRWGLAVLLILALQVGGLFVFARKGPPMTATSLRTRGVRFGGSEMEHSRFGELIALHDPTLFSDPRGRGFSDFRWLAPTSVGYQVTNWTEPYQWLAAEQRFLGDDFAIHVAGSVPPSAALSAGLSPALASIDPKHPTFPSRAYVSVEGALSGWQWSGELPPVHDYSMPLTNTVLRVLANQLGALVSASLMISSGSSAADQSAIEYTRRTRLVRPGPVDHRDNGGEFLLFGQVRFQWFPATFAATNRMTAKP